MNKNLEAITKKIQQSGFKLTKQRKAILEVFLLSNDHLQVEEIFEQAKKNNKSLNLTTVYRTLNWLQKYGFANAHYFKDNKASFEPNLEDSKHHDHLICTKCNYIIEFFNIKIEEEQIKIANKHSFIITSHKMELYGICQKCSKF